MKDAESLWTGDMNETAVEEWKAETSPFDRVHEVLLTVISFRDVGTIAEQAAVSESTARKYLTILAEGGFAKKESTSQGMRFKRSHRTVAIQQLKQLYTDFSRVELISANHNLKSQIQSYRTQYDVSDPDDLVATLEPDAEDWEAIGNWQSVERDLRVVQAALLLHDFDPDADETHSDDSTNGSFGDETGLSV